MKTLKYGKYLVVESGIDAESVVHKAEATQIVLLRCLNTHIRNYSVVLELNCIHHQLL